MEHTVSRQDGNRPQCLYCDDPAFAVVVTREVDPMPYCYSCGSEQVEYGGIEYPLESFYEAGDHVSQMAYDGKFRLFEPGDPSGDTWIEATNTDVRGSSVILSDWI